MKRKMLLLGLVASLAISSTTWAQAPAVPAAPVAAPAAPAQANIFSMLLPNKEQCAHLKNAYCNSGIGQMVGGMAGPFSLMSGGLIKNRCLQNSILNDLKKPADSPEGAAARVKADEAEAKARRDAVRVLGLVDCNYWPEAIATLKVALRGDRNECVRFEAALALRNGCCCNKEIIKALEMSVTGSNADGFPAERSERVRAAAGEALARCPIIHEEIEKVPEKLTKNQLSPDVDPTEYYKKVSRTPNAEVIASARAALANLQKEAQTPPPDGSSAATPASTSSSVGYQRPGSLAGIVSNAFGGDADPATRMPFFTGLTRSLTGKQDNSVQQYMAPTNVNPTRMLDAPKPSLSETSTPMPVGETSILPRDKSALGTVEAAPMLEPMMPLRDQKIVAPAERQIPTPANQTPASLGRPFEGKATGEFIQVSPHVRQIQQPAGKSSTPVEMFPAIPVLPAVPNITPPNSSLPRESRGTVTLEFSER